MESKRINNGLHITIRSESMKENGMWKCVLCDIEIKDNKSRIFNHLKTMTHKQNLLYQIRQKTNGKVRFYSKFEMCYRS